MPYQLFFLKANEWCLGFPYIIVLIIILIANNVYNICISSYELFFVKLINGVLAFLILLLPQEIYSPREFLAPDKLKMGPSNVS